MSGYSPHTPGDIAAMLDAIGVATVDDLTAHVPAHLRANAAIDLPPGAPASDVWKAIQGHIIGDGSLLVPYARVPKPARKPVV